MVNQLTLAPNYSPPFRDVACCSFKCAFLGHIRKIAPKSLERLWRLRHNTELIDYLTPSVYKNPDELYR